MLRQRVCIQYVGAQINLAIGAVADNVDGVDAGVALKCLGNCVKAPIAFIDQHHFQARVDVITGNLCEQLLVIRCRAIEKHQLTA